MGARQRNSEISDAVVARQQSGKDCGVRGVGDWTGCEGLGEADTIFCQGIERGSLDVVVAVAADVVRTQSVNGDKENIRAGSLSGRGFPRGLRRQASIDEDKKEKRPGSLHVFPD